MKTYKPSNQIFGMRRGFLKCFWSQWSYLRTSFWVNIYLRRKDHDCASTQWSRRERRVKTLRLWKTLEYFITKFSDILLSKGWETISVISNTSYWYSFEKDIRSIWQKGIPFLDRYGTSKVTGSFASLITGPSGKFRNELFTSSHISQLDTTSDKPIGHVCTRLTKRCL